MFFSKSYRMAEYEGKEKHQQRIGKHYREPGALKEAESSCGIAPKTFIGPNSFWSGSPQLEDSCHIVRPVVQPSALQSINSCYADERVMKIYRMIPRRAFLNSNLLFACWL
jgi:hypothetical protein